MAKLTELAHESPATTGSAEHVHVASTSRMRLWYIARAAHKKFGLTVHEFPSKWSGGDCLDCVHAVGSWHYRKKGDPFTPRGCPPASERCSYKNLALDAFGELAHERAFFEWVLHRFGRPSGWFVPF